MLFCSHATNEIRGHSIPTPFSVVDDDSEPLFPTVVVLQGYYNTRRRRRFPRVLERKMNGDKKLGFLVV